MWYKVSIGLTCNLVFIGNDISTSHDSTTLHYKTLKFENYSLSLSETYQSCLLKVVLLL